MIQSHKFLRQITFLSGVVFLLTNCQEDSNKMIDQNNSPASNTVSVSIISPANGQSSAQDQTITFSGTAVLGSSGQIAEENLIWTSDKDSVIGLGYSFTRNGLSVGNHTITLTATASSGEAGTATVQLNNQLSNNGLTALIESPAGSRIKPYDLIQRIATRARAGFDLHRFREYQRRRFF